MTKLVQWNDLRIALVALGAAGLAGCASMDPALYAVDAGSAASALEDGKTLKASGKTNASILRNWGDGTTEVTDNEFSIAKNADGGVDVTINGKTTSFTSADATADGYGFSNTDADGGRQVFSWAGPVATALDPNNSDYTQVWNYWFWDNDEQSQRNGWAVVGTETKADDLKNKASATYVGYMAGNIHDNVGSGDRIDFESGTNASNAVNPGGRVQLTADFDAATISGDVTGIAAHARTGGVYGAWQALPGRIVLNEATIDGNSYTGTMSAADGLPTDMGNSAVYSGKFYGITAQETAGTFEIKGDDANAVGFFRALEQ